MNKNHKKIIFIELVCIFLQIIFTNINFYNSIFPFGITFAIVRIFYGGNIFCIIFSYAISKFNFIFSFVQLFICFFEIIILSLYYFLIHLKSFKKPLLILELFVAISTLLSFYYMISFVNSLILYSVDLISKLLMTMFFFYVIKNVKNKKLFLKFNSLDYLYFWLISLFLTYGVYILGVSELNLEYSILVILISFFCLVFPNDKFCVLTMALGVGSSIAIKSYELLLFSLTFSIVLMTIKHNNKFIYTLIELFVCVILAVFLDVNYVSLVFALLGIIIMLLIPRSFIKKLALLFEIDSVNIICETLRIEKLSTIKNKLKLMSDTLRNMQKDLKFLLVGKISHEKACKELSQDLINSCCKNCENYNTCFSQNINKKGMFENLLAKSIKNGNVNYDDVVFGLQSYCNKEMIIVSEINQITKVFLQYENNVKNEDLSKLIIADELANFSDMFLNFSKSINLDLGINKNQSYRLRDNLIGNLIDAKEVAIIENKSGIESINIIAQNEHILRKDIVQIISKFTKNKMKLLSVRHLSFSGLGFASFVPIEKLLMNLAISTKAKESRNGDNVAMVKLSQNKYFIAIADGMGHGETASQISSMVLSLIRSMFEIGFDDELIIQSINKLLIPAGIDNFSSLDACIVDLQNEIATFIKLGASVSVLKHYNTSELISCESLPIGIVKNIRPTIVRKNLSVGDIIFLTSDGVVDSFSSVDEYLSYINDAKIINLQKFTDDLLFDSSFQNRQHLDDMSIIAINLLKKN